MTLAILDYTWACFKKAAPTNSRKGTLLPCYKATLCDPKSREKYEDKLALFARKDLYEIPPEAWKDDVELWPSTLYIQVGMYLKVTIVCR